MTDGMHWLFASGHAVDLVLCVILAEAVILVRRGWSGLDTVLLLLPGALILLALRAALVEAEWWWVALPLLASLPVHLADVANRRAQKN